MTETSVSPAPVEEKAPAKVDSPKKAAAKNSATKATHPSAADMATAAIKSLGERGGSSLQAIKKYIAATYKVDVEKQAPFIKKFLRAAVIKGTLVQTKGKGASGSFKLAAEKAAPKPKKAVAKKPAAPKKSAAAKKPAAKKATGEAKAAKKPASPKKVAVKKSESKKPAAKAPAKTKAAASPKAKKAAKAPTAKPKSPKPKKVAAPKAPKPAARKAPAVRN